VVLFRDGREVRPDEPLAVLSTDFLAAGGDGAFGPVRARDPDAITIEDDPPVREAMAEALAALAGQELQVRASYDPDAPRVRMPGPRPIRCAP
jgi:hypothetical protein